MCARTQHRMHRMQVSGHAAQRGTSQPRCSTTSAPTHRAIARMHSQPDHAAVQMLAAAYQSRQLEVLGGPDGVFQADQDARARMRAAADTETFQNALRRLLPWPCTRRYTIVTTVQATVLRTLVAVASQCAPWLVGALMLGALWAWHGRRCK
jgi:hypothetical protein